MEHTIDQPHGRESRSPWSRYNEKQEVRINPNGKAITGDLTIPGSKSLTNRALIIAALAEGTSRLEGILKSDDSYWCIQCLRQLGVQIDVEGETAIIHGSGGAWPNREGDLYFGAAGTIARFLPGALAAGSGSWKLQGSPRLSERPLAPLLDALSALGADIHYEAAQGRLPLTLHAKGLQGSSVSVPGSVSSQFISGLLLAAPYAHNALTVHIEGTVVQRDYVEMTLDMMRTFGVETQPAPDSQSISVQPDKYQAQSLALEPDVSTCGYFWSMAAQTNGRVRIQGINDQTRQPDIEILDVLERMGCTVVRGADFIEVTGTRQLKGGFTASMKRWSDQTLTIAALAPFADGPITLTDAAHIRHHECDRIAAICTELGKLGIRVEEHPDGLTVYPGEPKPALLDTYDDHRVAMALSLIAVKADGIRIADPGCVSKTCPDYWDRLSALGLNVTLS
ncbi:3-phosphoshikimate 1-carboxyvinyltransferase [Paenibacillus sp. UNC451MF]|uniref:3-phosphoshikimate 1-carboxyvinyltransferase n=1 Tax=Paenibacillus sp. UNC451MF TaxID=1449063 RepID=UPI00055A377D|nr:3-phosphoshikimate 1-carboxyvinyltransferase [Paenibacillus sp. UNC451MF]